MAPVVLDLERLADGHAVLLAGADLDPVVGLAIPVETHLEALDRQLLCVLEAEVRAPLVSKNRHGQIGAEASRDELLIECGALMVDVGEGGKLIPLLANNNELVEERIHLGTH